MRKLDRSNVVLPQSLAGPSAEVGSEMAKVLQYYAAHSPWKSEYRSYKFKAYRPTDVRNALRILALGKCAYCEDTIGSVGAREVEHYRPKGGVDEDPDHPGYWWLAHKWENLLPTCIACNRSRRHCIVEPGMTRADVEALMCVKPAKSFGKANQFKIGGKRACSPVCSIDDEAPLLIDPCRRDPQLELRWDHKGELSLVVPLLDGDGKPSPQGEYTIYVCALNRAELVITRTAPLRTLRGMRTRILEKLERWSGDTKELDDLIESARDMRRLHEPDLPFSAMLKAFVDEFFAELEHWVQQKGIA